MQIHRIKFQDQVQHFKILRDGMGKYFLWTVKFDSINELIDHHRTTSVNRGQTVLLRDMVSSTQNENATFNANKTTSRATSNNSEVQTPKPPVPVTPVNNQNYIAAYDFSPEEDGEIELKRGDMIRMIDQSDPNWWKGEVRGQIGLFPATYVRSA